MIEKNLVIRILWEFKYPFPKNELEEGINQILIKIEKEIEKVYYKEKLVKEL